MEEQVLKIVQKLEGLKKNYFLKTVVKFENHFKKHSQKGQNISDFCIAIGCTIFFLCYI